MDENRLKTGVQFSELNNDNIEIMTEKGVEFGVNRVTLNDAEAEQLYKWLERRFNQRDR